MSTLPENINSTRQKSTNEMTSLMQTVLDLARKKGATDAAVTVNHDSGFSVDVHMGDVETVAFNEDRGVDVTIYLDHCMGSASSSDTSPEAVESMVEAALEIAKVSAPDPCFGLPDAELISNTYPDLDLYHPWQLNPQQAIAIALDCEKQALGADKRISMSDGVNITTHVFGHGYATSQGFIGVLHNSRHSMSCSLVAKENDNNMQRDYAYTTARRAEDLLPIDKLAILTAERATSRLGAKKIKTQRTPVIFSSRISSGLFGTLVSAISGSNLYRKNSFLLNAIGQQIFPADIYIHEQPYLLGGLGSTPFDGEGVPTRNNVLVQNGKLCQYVLNSYTARKLGLKTTANAGGVFNLTIDATAGDFKDILQRMGTGLLVTEVMGNGINILTGDYSRGANGFWVENGEIQYPVDEITIASNLKEMFQGIMAVGMDINPNSSTRCGSVLIREMMIGGQ